MKTMLIDVIFAYLFEFYSTLDRTNHPQVSTFHHKVILWGIDKTHVKWSNFMFFKYSQSNLPTSILVILKKKFHTKNFKINKLIHHKWLLFDRNLPTFSYIHCVCCNFACLECIQVENIWTMTNVLLYTLQSLAFHLNSNTLTIIIITVEKHVYTQTFSSNYDTRFTFFIIKNLRCNFPFILFFPDDDINIYRVVCLYFVWYNTDIGRWCNWILCIIIFDIKVLREKSKTIRL